MSEEVNIDTGQMIYYHTLVVGPSRADNPEIFYEDTVEELKREIAKTKVRLDKPYKITLKVEEL